MCAAACVALRTLPTVLRVQTAPSQLGPLAACAEPMINQGSHRDKTWPDGWTSATEDGKRSAQFEHTLVITPTGYDILTARLPTSPPLCVRGAGQGQAACATGALAGLTTVPAPSFRLIGCMDAKLLLCRWWEKEGAQQAGQAAAAAAGGS